ncbi:unnamed protein product [Chrysoparadoxa australica]
MRLYGLYKAATVGPCTAAKPRSVLGNSLVIDKWENWRMAGTLTKNQAMKQYMTLASTVMEECGKEAGGGQDEVREIQRLNARTKELEKILQRIEDEVQQMDDLGNDMSGWLYKWRDREAYIWGSPKWDQVYLTLKDDVLRLYDTDKEPRPNQEIRIHNCILRDEGTKEGPPDKATGKCPIYHIFGIYLDDEHGGADAGVMLRLSSASEDEAQLWLNALSKACVIDDIMGMDLASGEEVTEGVKDATATPLPRSATVIGLKRRSGSFGKTALLTPAKPPVKGHFDPTAYPASKPMHKEVQFSLLSVESPDQNYRGLLNLGALLLLVNNVRAIWANFLRYGVRTSFPSLTNWSFGDWPCLTGTLALTIHVVVAYLIETYGCPAFPKRKRVIGESSVLLLHGINITLVLVIPVHIVWHYTGHPVFGFCYLYTATLLWMKLISYAHCMHDVRRSWVRAGAAAKKKEETKQGADQHERGRRRSMGERKIASVTMLERMSRTPEPPPLLRKLSHSSSTHHNTTNQLVYPNNLTLRDILYFWFAPTLCYQLTYPRASPPRWQYCFGLLLRIIFFSAMMFLIVDQYIVPTVHSSYHPFVRGEILGSLEHLLAIMVPVTYTWLLLFYTYFHLLLNLLAELLRFGDRVFYKDWWNATTLDAFWRKWNLGVHFFMARHLYFPLLRKGYKKRVASLLCFLLSAFFHELLISVPFRMVKFYAFAGMLANVPLSILTDNIAHSHCGELTQDPLPVLTQLGNILFWVTFCLVGQPMSVLLYYMDYRTEHGVSA